MSGSSNSRAMAAMPEPPQQPVQPRISVWWDIENCGVPLGLSAYSIAHNVRSALGREGFHGTISITAYGNVNLLSRGVTEGLSSTGISVHHIPNGRKQASDKAILVGMLLWALDNPPPAHVLLVSGDQDFSNALHGLRNRKYNVLLAYNMGTSVSQSLLSSATKVWNWPTLANGESLLPLLPSPTFPSSPRPWPANSLSSSLEGPAMADSSVGQGESYSRKRKFSSDSSSESSPPLKRRGGATKGEGGSWLSSPIRSEVTMQEVQRWPIVNYSPMYIAQFAY